MEFNGENGVEINRGPEVPRASVVGVTEGRWEVPISEAQLGMGSHINQGWSVCWVLCVDVEAERKSRSQMLTKYLVVVGEGSGTPRRLVGVTIRGHKFSDTSVTEMGPEVSNILAWLGHNTSVLDHT